MSVSAARMDGDGARLVDDNHVIGVLQDLQGRVLHWHLVSVTRTSRSRQPRGNLISLQTHKITMLYAFLTYVFCFLILHLQTWLFILIVLLLRACFWVK